jgi:hypothetical protein
MTPMSFTNLFEGIKLGDFLHSRQRDAAAAVNEIPKEQFLNATPTEIEEHRMIVHIIIEVVLGIVMLYTGQTVWQLYKRERFLKVAIRTPEFLESLISEESLGNPPPRLMAFTQKQQIGYVLNIKCAVDADKISIRRLAIPFGVAVAAILVGSYFIGPVFLAINVLIFILTALIPLDPSARSTATDFILTIGLILHIWRLEDAKQCDEFIAEAWSLRPLYEAVSKAQRHRRYQPSGCEERATLGNTPPGIFPPSPRSAGPAWSAVPARSRRGVGERRLPQKRPPIRRLPLSSRGTFHAYF